MKRVVHFGFTADKAYSFEYGSINLFRLLNDMYQNL